MPKPAHFGLGALYAVSPQGVVGCVGAGAIIGSFFGLGHYVARQVGMDVAATTQFMGVTIVGGLALQWPIGRPSDRFDRRAVLVGLCAAICIVSLAAAAVTGGSLTALLVLAPLFAGVVDMDNLSVHKVKGVRQAIEAVGAKIAYLPPYSPDLNPIEQFFAKLKALLRKAAERSIDAFWNTIGRLLDQFTNLECRNYIRNAGYVQI